MLDLVIEVNEQRRSKEVAVLYCYLQRLGIHKEEAHKRTKRSLPCSGLVLATMH